MTMVSLAIVQVTWSRPNQLIKGLVRLRLVAYQAYMSSVQVAFIK